MVHGVRHSWRSLIGMKTVILKCSAYSAMDDFYVDIAEKLELPEMEKSIGALRECLRSITEDVCIAFTGYEEFAQNAGVMTLPLRAMLSGIPEANPCVRIAFL